MTEAHKTDGLAELVCSNSLPLRRRRDQRGRPAARGDAPRRLADHERGRRAQAAGRRRTGRRPRPFLGHHHASPRRAPARSPSPAARSPAFPRPTGPASSSPRGRSPRRRSPPPSSSSRARASSPSSTPSRRSCTWSRSTTTITWRQSRYDKAGPGGTGADYINCPMSKAEYEAFLDALLAAREDLVQGVGGLHPLLRRLPAHRGDGRARPRDAALRAR